MYRAGLVGCGGVSWSHARGLQLARGVELVALADVYEPNLRTAGQAYGVERLYADAGEMFRREALDVVTICTQAPSHAPLVLAAAEAGVRGVLCEKPIALTLAEADAMIETCVRTGTRLAINHQTRMIPNTALVEDLLGQGAVGELRAARMLDKGGRPAGNSLMELLTHVFDLLRLYAGDPAWVSAHLTVDQQPRQARPSGAEGQLGESAGRDQRLATVGDIVYSQAAWPGDRDCGLVLGDRCSATFGFHPRRGWHSGLTATVESYFQPIRSPSTAETWSPSLELLGTDGIIFLGGTSDHVDVYLHRGPWAPPGRLERRESPDQPPRELVVGGRQAPYHTAMVEELLAAIEQGREHRSSGVDGRWALEMVMGVYESQRRGGARVSLPLRYRDHPLQRWIDETGARAPVKPAPPVRTLRFPSVSG
ncbi:MAG TPA: Gfo/Idh/MocA family oxidoreductase [Chloroflexota bacterium]|nr:Gfo/Idh/MocA family oxidoreductase [Chloroflexota bacterium]